MSDFVIILGKLSGILGKFRDDRRISLRRYSRLSSSFSSGLIDFYEIENRQDSAPRKIILPVRTDFSPGRGQADFYELLTDGHSSHTNDSSSNMEKNRIYTLSCYLFGANGQNSRSALKSTPHLSETTLPNARRSLHIWSSQIIVWVLPRCIWFTTPRKEVFGKVVRAIT